MSGGCAPVQWVTVGPIALSAGLPPLRERFKEDKREHTHCSRPVGAPALWAEVDFPSRVSKLHRPLTKEISHTRAKKDVLTLYKIKMDQIWLKMDQKKLKIVFLYQKQPVLFGFFFSRNWGPPSLPLRKILLPEIILRILGVSPSLFTKKIRKIVFEKQPTTQADTICPGKIVILFAPFYFPLSC